MIALPKEVNKAVKTDIYEALRQGLTAPDSVSKKSWAQNFITTMLKEAKKNPNGALGQLIARQIMADDILQKLDAETDRQLARDIDFNTYRIHKTLYKEQQQVFNDIYSKRIIVIGSRRIGKSELAARLLVRDVLKPNHHALYCNLTFDNAIKQSWDNVIELIESLNLPTEKTDKSEGTIMMANGSDIRFKGNNDKAAADKLLGYKYSLAIIDEVQTQRNLQYLLDTVLTPTTADYEDSQIICLGTPPRIPKTYCERIWKEFEGWSKYSWNMLVNPFLKNIPALIDAICKEKGTDRNAPFIQREYYGSWIFDKESQVYKDALIYETLPKYTKIDYVYGGVDFGFSDYNAIVTIGWDDTAKKGYVIDCYKFNRATVTEIIEKAKIALENAQKLLLDSGNDPHNVMFYGDTSDKSIIYELQTNYDFPIQCAYKHNKMEAISVLAELLRRKIYTKANTPLIDEYEQTVYKRDEATDAILSEIDDETFHPDATDALLYASRALIKDYNPIGAEDRQIDKVKEEYFEEDEAYIMPSNKNHSDEYEGLYA